MSAAHDTAGHDEAERMHREGIRVAERLDATISAILAEMGRKKGFEMNAPVHGVIHRDHAYGVHCYAVWQLLPDRGHFMLKLELHSDEVYSTLYLKAFLQSRFWDREAEKFGQALCQTTNLRVDIERTQTDGIVTYSASLTPDQFPAALPED